MSISLELNKKLIEYNSEIEREERILIKSELAYKRKMIAKNSRPYKKKESGE